MHDDPPNRSADNTGPEHSSESVHDNIFDPPLEIELAEGSDSHRIWVVSPHAWWGLVVTLLRCVLGCERVCIRHEDWQRGKVVWK